MADEVRVHHTPPPAGGDGATNARRLVVGLLLVGLIAWFMFGAGVEEAREITGVDLEVPPELEVAEEVDVNAK